MDKEIYHINEAIVLLSEGAKLKDNISRLFLMKKDRIYVYSNNSSYSLSSEEFLELYKDNQFIIFIDEDDGIDNKRDEEYYGFKHK